jgi:hypothetical protein
MKPLGRWRPLNHRAPTVGRYAADRARATTARPIDSSPPESAVRRVDVVARDPDCGDIDPGVVVLNEAQTPFVALRER